MHSVCSVVKLQLSESQSVKILVSMISIEVIYRQLLLKLSIKYYVLNYNSGNEINEVSGVYEGI